MTATIKPEEIKSGVNDFSILTSSRYKKDLMFLGPAAYINHCCSNNTEWVPGRGEGIWCAKAIQNISIGTEITTNYGDNYFGPNQQYCECRCHPDKVQVNDVDSMGTDTETEEIETDSESMDTDTEDTDTKLENMGKQDQQESEMPVASTSVKPVTQGTTFFLNFTIYHVNFCHIDSMGTDTETEEIETVSEIDSKGTDTETE
ncbi:histone-lysine N-methyltransferase KMT5B-like [Acyrthosiphon pisum]|uniref:SET domain-containing protein n=1 Tax=Acyrthosiphon pisum TaxID=7029 RepID=A0A8R2NJK1_ACYPI|nr:histone-lysine N-methyltransferase KMT5B-like [Acyrthosiphon pisum]